MRQIITIESGRADAVPLKPVIAELRRYFEVTPWGWYNQTLRSCTANFIDKPDLVVILGDRWESLGMAWSATVAQIPIAHIHGGETTLGSFDNQIRHAISKLAHIHFVAHEQFKDKLISIGEDPKRIHVVGAPGLDNLVDLPERKPGKYFVLTYHPETLGETDVEPVLKAVGEFTNYTTHWTGANNDPEAKTINTLVENWPFISKATNSGGLTICRSWSAREYIEMCRNAAVVIGNSSSGLIEMPALEVPTVNVGRRQDGRPCGPSVFNCQNEKDAIVKAIKSALCYAGPYDNPYGGPGASKKIADILMTAEIDMIKE